MRQLESSLDTSSPACHCGQPLNGPGDQTYHEVPSKPVKRVQLASFKSNRIKNDACAFVYCLSNLGLPNSQTETRLNHLHADIHVPVIIEHDRYRYLQ